MQLRRLPHKLLVQVSTILLEEKNYDFNNPWSDMDTTSDYVEQASKWTSADVDNEDVEFISKFISENESLLQQYIKGEVLLSEILNSLTIPQPKEYKLWYEVWGNAVVTEEYSTVWTSYDEKWVKESLMWSYIEGRFDYYEGKYEGMETDNFETDNFEITQVSNLNESKKSLLSKLVLENTTDVLDNLDRDTLIDLRNLINQKLSSS